MPVFSELDLSPNRIELARRRASSAAGYIDLTSSNPTQQGLLFPPAVLQTIAAAYWEQRRYEPDPHGMPAARAAIQRYYAQRIPPLAVSEDALFITASTSEAYNLLFALLTDPGDNLLAPTVTYPLFEYFAALHRVELRPYRLDEARNWQIDPDSLRQQADERSRAVLLVSPHNPTGAMVSASLPVLDELGLPLMCDEVFAPFAYRVAHVPPIAALHPALPVFQLNGISKMFALPDMKLGWIALNEPARARYRERLELLNDTFLGASGLAQHMLPGLFEFGGVFVHTMVERVRRNLDMALHRLGSLPTLRVSPPDGGYYLFPALRDDTDEEDLVLSLLEQGVLVHPGYFYGDVPGTHMLLSALTVPTVFEQGLERLCAALA